MKTDHHGIDIVISDVDHTTIRVLECLNKRAKAAETRRLPCIPVILLMPENIDEDMKSNLQHVGGYDVILPLPITPRELFNSLMDLLYRRKIVESAYNDLRKEQRNIKYPHLQIFEDEKLPLHHVTVDEEDEEEEDDDDRHGIHTTNSNELSEHLDEEFDDYSSYDFDDQMNPSQYFDTTDFSTSDDYSIELHPSSIIELRNYYTRLKKKRNTSNNNAPSSIIAQNPLYNNNNNNRPLDPKEKQQLDRFIVKSILKDNNMDLKDNSDSDEDM